MRVAKAGWPFILGCAATGCFSLLLALHFESAMIGMLAGIAFLGAAFCAYFFRDPHRVIPQEDHLILSPCDGRITEIVEGTDPFVPGPVWIIRVFLSVFDPHIQRTPIQGQVKKITYTQGCFLDARNPKACVENEQNRLDIEPASPRSVRVAVTQIAGLIARRIVCWVGEGYQLKKGEQFGLIRFGSQVNLMVPKSVTLKVRAGDYIRAGCDIVGEIAR